VCCSSIGLALSELGLREPLFSLVPASVQVFYSLRSGSYNETQGPTGGPEVDKTIYSRALIDRSSK
jgi:hypothetical protein